MLDLWIMTNKLFTKPSITILVKHSIPLTLNFIYYGVIATLTGMIDNSILLWAHLATLLQILTLLPCNLLFADIIDDFVQSSIRKSHQLLWMPSCFLLTKARVDQIVKIIYILANTFDTFLNALNP